jgi:hypothetical protein
MDSLYVLCVSPLIVGVLLLLVEYLIIQPIQDAKDLSVLNSSGNVDDSWSQALKKAIAQFKHLQSSTFFFPTERVKIEEVMINRDIATLITQVKPRASLLFILTRMYSSMKVDGIVLPIETKYKLTVDRGGEIKEVRVLEESSIRHTIQPSTTPSAHPRTGIVLKKIEKPVTEIFDGKLVVTIKFVVENWGESRTIRPDVKFTVAELVNGNFREKVITSPDDWIIDLRSNTIHPLSFTQEFNDINIVVLTKPPHKVSVRLIAINK